MGLSFSYLLFFHASWPQCVLKEMRRYVHIFFYKRSFFEVVCLFLVGEY